MADNDPKKKASPLPIIAILAILGSVYYASSQLKSSRPEAPTGMTHAVPEKGKIDARLWQDPLKVACEHEKTFHGTEKKYVFKIIPDPLRKGPERPIYAKEIGENESNASESSPEHSFSQVKDRISFINETWRKDVNTPVHILLTMIRDGISAEDHERRLRNRYAMATALHSSGLVPEDPMHIQYFRLPWIERNELEEKVQNGYTEIPKIVEDPKYTSEPLIVPYEWFEQEEVYLSQPANTGEDDRPKYVLLVWLPESAFSHRPLTRLAQVIEALGNDLNSNGRIDMIGPSHSGTLQTMLSEITDMNDVQSADLNCVDVNSMLDKLTIFSPWSTVSPALLVKEKEWPSHDANNSSIPERYEVIPDKFKKVGVTFVRMIGSDDLLAMELINELARRGVDVLCKKHNVALISEWDTFYGNAFPLTFATMMESIDPNTGSPNKWHDYMVNLNLRKQSSDSNFPGNLHTYSYIRGIDGKLPESQSSKEEKSKDKSEYNSNLTYTKGRELPTGRSQLDYIRRLTQKLSDKYEYFGNNKLKAIGVVGSDVYDKLVLLQALREQFSDMIIFTIDIDARMMHPEQFKWTRNVIVASNYGLEFSDTFKSDIYEHRAGSLSPFRDNYQTSLFLACRTALTPDRHSGKLHRKMSREELTEIISHPQLFEIGRGSPVNLTVSDKEDVFGIHPPRTPWPGWKAIVTQKDFILLAIAIVFFVIFVVKISRGLERIVPLLSKKGWNILGFIIKVTVRVVILSIIISFVATVIYDHYREGGEPFSLDAGVSIWPGQILRLIAFLVGVSLIIRLMNKLHESKESLGKKFSLEPLKSEMEQQHTNNRKRQKSRFSWKSFNKEYKLKLSNGYHDVERFFDKKCSWVLFLDWTPKGEIGIKAQKLWMLYLKDSKLSNRIRRIFPMAVVYMLLSALIMNILGQLNTPFRGEISLLVNQYILIPSGIYMIILIFLVVDATYLSLRLTGLLIKINTKWPDGAMKKIKDDPDIEKEDFAELLDVRFITQLTEDIGKMIYLPFIVLGVMAAARFPYFDNWNFPLSLIIMHAIPSIYLIICAVILQHSAKRVRAKALNYLNDKLFEARFGKDENKKRALKLTHMIREIESVHKGAFRPFYENPVIHVLFGSGGAGLLALLKYMPL